MISAEEIREDGNPIRSSVAVPQITPLRAKTLMRTDKPVRSLASYELSLSSSQLLVGFLSALSAVGVLLWAFLKLWLFAR